MILIFFGIDLYVFQAFKTAFGQSAAFPIITGVFWAISGIIAVAILLTAFVPRDKWSKSVMVYLPSAFLSLTAGKLVIGLFLFLDDIVRGVRILVDDGSAGFRIQELSIAGIIVAGIPFLLLMYGMIRNAYNYQVRNIKLELKNLPEALRGLKIVQLSDIHSGSLTRPARVKEAVKRVNDLNPDLIFFTGDLVNMVASEIEPYIPVFKELKAKYGVYSITGNHDYGDYVQWDTAQDKKANFQSLMDSHSKLGWRLLMNEHEKIKVGDSHLGVIGIENWSAFGRFPKYGNLKRAYQGVEGAAVKLLLSHDPSHWKAEVLTEYPNIDVMFAGHTHGFQFGFEIGDWKWSPGQYFYKEWAGLYKTANQYLYVNRGFGFTFYPGRVGMLPEISVFELN